MASFSAKSIPVFPPWCLVPPVETECTAFGITLPCVAKPDVQELYFGQEIAIGHWMTTLSLVGIGVINLSYVEFPFERKDAMKIITGFYSFFTGIFSLIRLQFGVSRFLLMAAAVHNIFEWAMLMMIAADNISEADVYRRIKYFGFFMYSIIVLVFMMPTLISAVFMEQATGITIDYALAFIFVYMYVTNANRPEIRSFYYYPAIAHSVHLLFTIIPLVFANFHAGHTTWYNSFYLETAIYISAPITHILYMIWSFEFDKKKGTSDEKDKTGLLPSTFRVDNVKTFVGIGFICGAFTLFGIPFMLGSCPTAPSCKPSQEIVGTSVAVVQPGFDLAFEDYIHSQQLESKALAFEGNRGYSLVKDLMHPHTYRFVERWDSKEHLDAWIAQVGGKVFSQPALMNLLVGGHLQQLTGYTRILSSSCRNVTHGGIAMDVKSSCDKVWSVVSDWSNCRWIVGCKYAVVDPKTNTRTLYINDGTMPQMALRKLSDDDHELVYDVLNPTDPQTSVFTGTINVGETGSLPNCTILLQFIIPKTIRADDVYQEFLTRRVPELQKLFSD